MVCGLPLGVADRVELQVKVAQAQLTKPCGTELDDLSVKRGARRADGFDVELEKLPVAALLRAVVSKHRSDEEEARRLRALVQTGLEISADDSGGRLGSERGVPSPTIVEAIQLFGDGIGVSSDALDQFRMLDDRRHDLLVAEAPCDARRRRLDGAPERTLLRHKVAHTADTLDRFASGHWVTIVRSSGMRPALRPHPRSLLSGPMRRSRR